MIIDENGNIKLEQINYNTYQVTNNKEFLVECPKLDQAEYYYNKLINGMDW